VRFLFPFLLIPACAWADPDLPLRQGDLVTVLRTDGTRKEARYSGTAEDPPRLLLVTKDARRWSGWTEEVPLASVARLEARGATEFHEVRILKGVLFGMVAGGVLTFVLHGLSLSGHSEPLGGVTPEFSYDDRITDTVHGMQAGSVVGGLVGLLTAGSSGPTRAWTFDERGHPVPSESGR
jgi:hypothetical protein